MATNIITNNNDNPNNNSNQNKILSWFGKFEKIQKSSLKQIRMNKCHLKEIFHIFKKILHCNYYPPS